MTKYSKLAIALVAGCCMLQTGQALADTITWDEPDSGTSAVTFPNFWDCAPGTDSVYNNPDLKGIHVAYDGDSGILQSITIDSQSPLDIAQFSTLYLNVGGTGEAWDYIVHSGGMQNANEYTDTPSKVPEDGIWKVKDPNNFTYTLVSNPYGREDHPNGISKDDLTFYAMLTPTIAANQNSIYITDGWTITYDFADLPSALSITLGSDFTIGWTPYCANDVIYEEGKRQSEPSSIPEPATMVLFGASIAVLASWRRSRKGNTQNNK